MEKKIVYGFMLLVTSAVLLIGGLQYMRFHPLHELFPQVGTTVHGVEILPDAKNNGSGTALNVYIVESDSELSRNVTNNIKHSLEYAKVPYEMIDSSVISTLKPSPFTILVLAGEHTDEWPLAHIKNFVNSGGQLYIGARFFDAKWNDLVGIKHSTGDSNEAYGLTFEQPMFPGYRDLAEEDEVFGHSMVEAELLPKADWFLSAESYPILWKYQYGKGNVMYWNTTITEEKITRGLVLQSMSFLTPAFAMNQAAIKILYIDDFPAPIPDAKLNEMTDMESDMPIQEFYANYWWEDLLRLKKNYDLKYTGVVIGNYEEHTRMPDKYLIQNAKYPMLYFGRKLLNTGGEIGLHGFNHQPLVTKNEPVDPEYGYIPWEDKEAMKLAISRMDTMYKHYFPNLEMTSYVPPSNVLNDTGLAALAEALPNMKTIAALYTGNLEDGDFIQEFEYDSKYSSIYHFPRISDGYGKDKGQIFSMQDAIANFGVFSHFIHPDDAFDPDRNEGKDWEGMAEGLEDILKEVHERYGYLEALTQSEATEKLIQYQNSKINISYEEDKVYIAGTGMVNPSVVLLRLEDGKSLEEGKRDFGTISLFDEESNLYLVKLTKSAAEIEIRKD